MDKSVKVYSTSTCPYCKMLKAFLKEKNIPFENLDVGEDENALKEMREYLLKLVLFLHQGLLERQEKIKQER